MTPQLMPLNEASRLRALARYDLLDTPPEAEFDRITALAAKFFKVPIAQISLVDRSRQWHKSSHGIPCGETPRDIAFCAHTILTNEPFIVPDATADERFFSNPLVTGLRHIRFYAGVPLTTADGANLGALCLIDTEPRTFSDSDAATLTQLAAMVVAAFDARVTWLCLQQELDVREQIAAALEQAKETAERANQAKSDFLSRMSHELRTPLNAILGFSQLLELDAQTISQQESVRHVMQAGRHLLKLIDEVLDISRVESGHVDLSLEAVPIYELVEETVNLIRPLAAQHRVAVSVCGAASKADADRGLHVTADRQRLKQVLLNLLSNAVKYNVPEGQVILAYSLVSGYLRLTVANTGPGIPPEKRARLFTPFDRLDAERSGVEGTGLGLALSKNLMEAMGGSIGLEEEFTATAHTAVDGSHGPGAVFFLRCRLADNPLDVLSLAGGIPAREAARGEALPWGRTLLYIEDNLSNLNLVEQLMTAYPEVRLLTAMQGTIGLGLAQQHQPDLILLDLHLPDMFGAEVLRRLRTDDGTRDIPTVIISADATRRQIEHLRKEGAYEYLTKPFDLKRFLAVVREILVEDETTTRGQC